MMAQSVRTGSLLAVLHDFVTGVAFWSAIGLAFAYPFVLFSLDRGYVGVPVLLLVIALHVLALVIGRGYAVGVGNHHG